MQTFLRPGRWAVGRPSPAWLGAITKLLQPAALTLALARAATPFAFLLLLLGALAVRPQAAMAASADTKSATVGVQSGTQYAIPALSGTSDLLNNTTGYRFASVPAAASGTIQYPTATNGSGTAFTTATVYNATTNPVTLTTLQAAKLFFVPAAGASAGSASFTYSLVQTGSLSGNVTASAAATYSLILAAADAQTSPILSNSAGQKAIPALTAGTISPTNYIIKTLPGSGTLYVGGTATTTNQIITAAQAATLSFTAATGFFGTTSFTYAPADANTTTTAGAGDVATYAIPVTTAVCGNNNNSVLDFSRRTVSEDWMNHASVAVNASNITSGNYTSLGASGGNSFIVDNNTALPGPSLAWRQVNTGSNPAVTPNTATVTFTFDQPVSNLSLSIQDLDKNVTTTQAFIDELTLDGYSTAASTTPITLAAANFALGNTNTFSGNNTVAGTSNSSVDPAGNIVVTFTSPVQRLTLTFKNTAPYTSATISRTHTIGLTSMTWCRVAPVANNVTTATLPNTAGQVGISSLSSTVDGNVTTYTIVTIPNATTQGTLYYNSTGTTYAAVTAGRTLTAAQAASLRFAPVSAASGNATFTYTVQDDNGQSSNAAIYTIPVINTPCTTGTSALAFNTRTTGEDWTSHAATPAPASSGFTTVSTSGYTSATTTNTFAIGRVNNTQTLQWATDYTSQTANTSTVTFNFNRPVSNFVVRVQDIDSNTGFIDQVVFTGTNGGTPVTPVLGPLPGSTNASTVAISGNTATGTANNSSATNATVLAYFPSPITTLTLTYSNISTTQADPANNAIGIDLLQFCRLAPVANDVTTATLLSSVGAASIASLASTVDGAATSYTLTSIPNASTQGVLSYNSGGTTYTNITSATQVLTAAQAASLRFAPVAGSTGNVTFGYKVTDDASLTSANTATYTIPVSNATCAGTGTLDFSSASVTTGDDWKNRAAMAVPTGSTMTTISSSGYSSLAPTNANTLNVVAANATNNVNGVKTLAWFTDYTSTSANTSSVTFTFNRAVSNFAVRVQDIDKAETTDGNGNVTAAFNDRVTFVGANGGTTVLPSLVAQGTANTVLINGNVATGTTNITDVNNGTVIAYFANPITTLTLTYSNISTYSTDPTANAIGIDLLNFCRLVPVASDVTNTSRPGGQGATAINSLNATADGTIASYTITALPAASQGTLFVGTTPLTTANFPGLVLTTAQAAQLTFAPAAAFTGNASFTYFAKDDAGLASNTANYTVPVTATGGAGTPAPCATPGKDGAAPALAGVVNTYFAGTASVAAKSSATSIPVAASVGASTGITPGDLLLVIQMQGADISSSNDSNYGANNGTGGGNLSNANFIAGTYEYVVATSSLAANTAGAISVAKLANSYSTAPATATTPRQSYQVVRIPQYASVTLGGQLDAQAWDGNAGGILAIDVAGTLNLNGKTLNAAATGFRGGAGFKYAGATGTTNTDYRTSSALTVNATKGEGIAGTPRYTLLSLMAAAFDNSTNMAAFTSGVVNGYPSGDNGKGAPGNAGGGGTDESTGNGLNDGGAGGANGGTGGLGGWPRIGSTVNTANQAVGGVSFAPVSSSRLVMGGGGGAGTSNDGNGDTGKTGIYSSGAPGGGLILVRTGTVSGTGTANASGGGGYTLTSTGGTNDGGGGGGAGGTVLFTASTPAGLTGLTVLATGGKGTSNPNTSDVAHGPGGGGGGGVILANGALNAASSVVGGAAGTIASSDSYNGTTYGAVAGNTGVLNTQISTSIANSAAGTACTADVATTITGPATASAGQPTGNFTATFSATNASGAANVTQTVTLPIGAGLTAGQQATIVAAYAGTTFTTTGTGTGTSTTINFGTTTLLSGASNSFVFAYTAPTTAGGYNTVSNTSTTTNESSQTANNTASVSTNVSVGADVTVSLSGPTTLNAGQPTGTFTATFTNEGPGTATSVARLVTLPTGASLTVSQQATIVAAYPNATFSTTGNGTSAVTIINFSPVPSLASDASSAVTFAFTAPTTVSTTLALIGNTSTTASEGTNLAPNQSTLTLTSVATADVAAAISGSTSVVGGVSTGTFNVAFTNNGPATAAGVTRTVQLPTGLTGVVVSGADAGSYSPTTGLVTYTTTTASLNTGATLSSVITFPIPTTGGQVVATANVNTTTNEAGLTTNNAASAVLPAAYDLTTTISGPGTAVAGSPVTLYVTTTNGGPSAAPTALQTVSIPSSVPLTNVYITNGGTYSYNSTTKIGTVTFPDPANPTSGVTVTNLPSGQTIANSISFTAPAENFAPTATAALNGTSTGTGDINPANNTAYLNGGVAGTPVVVNTSTTTLATANESTTLTTTSTIVSAGTSVTYKVAATNNGPGIATNVIEQVQLLPGLTASTLTVGGITGTGTNTITYTSGGVTVATYNATTGIVTYATLTTQASGTTQNFGDIVLTVPANTGNNGQLLATANVRTSTNDPAPADNVSVVAVKVTSTADLASTITGPTTTAAGQTASYTVAFTNNGTGTAGTVMETMQLPTGLSNVVVQDPNGNVLAGAYNSTTGLVTFPTIASDAVGTTQVYNVAFTAPGRTYSVSSSVSSGTIDNVVANNSSVLRTTVTSTADVAISVSGPATTTAGNTVTYGVTTLNNGPNAAINVVPSIQIPANLTGVTTIGGSYNSTTGVVTFSSYILASGESRLSLVTFPMPTNPTNGFVTGAASVTTTSTDPVASNNTAAITTSVAPATPDLADLGTSITPSASMVTAGSPISYTIRLRNNTASTPAINVVPTAYLPAGLTGVVVKDGAGVVIPNAYDSTTGQITFPTIASLTSSNGPDYTVSFTAPSNAGTVLISASAVSANTSDPNPTNNVGTNSVTITAAYDEVTSLAGPATALPGSTNTYTVTTTNNGPSGAPIAAGTVQTVTLPTGVTATNISGGGTQSGNVITFPAISTIQAAGTNGAVINTFNIVMPATGSLALSAAVTSTGESNTTNNGATLTTLPTNQVPVANNVWNTLQSARGNTANLMATKGLPISSLAATDPDGSIASYTITSLPDVSQGMLYYNNVAVAAGQTVAASGLSFAPASTFVGNATFMYTALDNGGAVSNSALYTIPVAKDMSAVYTAYNSTKGGTNKYVTGDVLAQVVDANSATYNSAGVIYDATTGVLQSNAANGLPTTGTNATLTSGTLPAGVSLDPTTGRIYVSNASQLVNNPGPMNYTVTITTVDSNGGVTTQPVSFTIGAYPLPVVLTDFTAGAVLNRDALLTWATASEKNNDHFDIERSFDGTSFTQIGQVAGHGTTTAASAYTLTDANVAAKATGTVYYRLRQVDLDGTATYSPVRSVRFTASAAAAPIALSLYPNPAQASTTLDLSQLPTTGTYQVVLLDATGRTVRATTLGGGLPQPLNISDLATGTYNVLVTGQLADGSALRQVLRLLKE